MSLAHPAQAQHELSISRLIDAPPAKVFRAWTEPQWLMQWWGPHGMTTPECEMQLWIGGLFRTLMRAPDGSEYPNQGVFLEIAAPRRLVFTDAFGPGWVPSDKAFMTAVISFDEEQGKTRYTARAWHWNAADCRAHEEMGFHQGWGESLDRLVEVVTQRMPD
ncbi:polyketide cyclase [Pseudomonas plecoglossicida]|uniref:SRPBCC family protein n=1 Tax=Pseudomonas asiatica TaxID=2219225 RepID=A0A9X4D941_9PSED|nr:MULTISPECIES: SRPBCC family protein [Pseudomonas]MEE1903864.1 SRPBCC family protein [Pseudomonas inefficax]GLO53008.1 activator of HSP90 ATPase [Pseudomonas putida]AGA74766.1 activator of Hsp90 ATPase 1 family protein [Pseudomonas putida HB3267]MCE0753698.1 SRPBCC family protein [Pseudomonas asiatica]MCE0943138.1 SRPBCC family protein [Pseudomonas asiatica]